MSLSALPTPEHDLVDVTADSLVLTNLVVPHPETVAIARRQLTEHGPDALADLIRRAVPVGLLALTTGAAATDTAVIQRTLDDFARNVDDRSAAALAGLNQTLDRLRDGEQAVAKAAQDALSRLPAQLESVLSAEAGNVRAAVAEAARAVQDTGTAEVRAALTQHSESVRNALSLDREGPVQSLRSDILAELNGTRRELSEQMTTVRGLLTAAQATTKASAKNSRAIGADWEEHAMGLIADVCAAAGDQFTAVGAQRGVNATTRRTGDGLVTLSPAITGHGRTSVHVVVEAKKRSRPMTAQALKAEAITAREVRGAAGCLILVPTPAEVPGGGRFARVDDLSFVVAADDPDTLSLVYLTTRELVALVTVRQHGDDGVDIAKAQAQLQHALTLLSEFDDVGRLAGAAKKNLESLLLTGARVRTRLHDALTAGLATLHP
ncbi:hypothetical protein [Pedococcus soli]